MGDSNNRHQLYDRPTLRVYTAIHYTVECTTSDPKTTERRTRWTVAIECLSKVTLDDTRTSQTMEPAKCATQIHHSTVKHTIWNYPTTIDRIAVSLIKEVLSLKLPETHNTHQPGAFTAYWNFRTDTSMVP